MKVRSRFVVLVATLFAVSQSPWVSPASGASRGASIRNLILQGAEVFQVTYNDVLYTCGGVAGGPYVPGSIDKKTGGFIPTSKLVKYYKKQLKVLRGKKGKRTKISLTKEQKYLKKAVAVCKNARPGTGTPIPEPTEAPKPQPTVAPVQPTSIPVQPTSIPVPTQPTVQPTAVPTIVPTVGATPSIPAGNNCDAQRRTTGFGIPAGLIGNGQTGGGLWADSCADCHGSGKRGSSYAAIFGSRSVGAMAGVRDLLTDPQNSADITADRNCP